MSQSKYKIALVGEMLSRGGAERVQARLSTYFENAGIEIHHIIFIDEVTYSYSGELFNLGKQKTSQNKWINKWLMLKAFKAYVKNQNFDFIIDFRAKHNYFQEYIITRFVYKTPYVMSIRSSNLKYHFPKNKFFAKLLFKKCYGFVAVSKSIASKVKETYNFSNCTSIYNPIDFNEIKQLSSENIEVPEKYILGIGRMQTNVKQFDHLIKAYANSEAKNQNFKLLLVGDGDYQKKLKKLVLQINLSNEVLFYPFTRNPFPYYKKAYFTALTSAFEGFPNVLIESLATGTPVVSYNCETGPDEIVIHNKNGLLVKNQDVDEMTNAINKLLDNSFHDSLKKESRDSVNNFSSENIVKDWLRFLKL